MGAPDRAPGTWLVTVSRNGRQVVRVASGEDPAHELTAEDQQLIAELLEHACTAVLQWPPWFTRESVVMIWRAAGAAEPQDT